MMDTTPFPPEILIHIFAFACTDSGATGCSLSFVSRLFYRLVRHTGLDLQSVAVCGVDQMLKFAAMLEKRKKFGERRHVKNLFIADRELPRSNSRRKHHSDPLPRSAALSISKTALDYSFSFLTYILNLIPPHHLLALTIDFATVETFPSLLPVLLPSLRELTVSGPVNKLSFRNSHQAPCLERLHIATHDVLPMDLWRAVTLVAPNIVDLRISSVGKEDVWLLGSLQQLLPRPSSSEESLLWESSTPHSKVTPQSLERVIIGFSQCSHSTLRGGNPSLRYRGLDVQIRAISREAGVHSNTRKRKIVALEPPPWRLDSQKAAVERAQRRWLWVEWLNGLDGKEGFWVY